MTQSLRFATYNVEWFNALFDDQGRPIEDREWSGRFKVTRVEQLTALGIVFAALNADVIVVIEAPDTNGKRSSVKALEKFAAKYKIRARRAVIGYVSDTEQEIALMYDPDQVKVRHDPQGDPAPPQGAPGAPRFDSQLRLDLNGDGQHETIRFSKPPLELALTTASGKVLRLIGVHVKSKAPHSASTEKEFIRISIENRRKQLAECLWLRTRVARHLAAGDSLLVLGDFNDGPGLDEYEKLFGHSGIEVVLGADVPAPERLYDPHADMSLRQPRGMQPTTARFWQPSSEHYFEALLDFIMVSPDLVALRPDWRIWHPFNDARVTAIPELADALLSASDHFPVTFDIQL